MELTSQQSPEASPEPTQPMPEAPQGPTAKQMAAMEELNQVRALRLAQQAAEPPPPPSPNITDVVSKGYDALHEQFRLHNERSKPKEYIPPPRTARQMSALEEELEAGRRAGERARAQQEESNRLKALQQAAEAAKEGFTTPVYRPPNAVPDPMTPAAAGGVAPSNRTYGPDA